MLPYDQRAEHGLGMLHAGMEVDALDNTWEHGASAPVESYRQA